MPKVKAGGIQLNYAVKGDGPPMVLSHGFQNCGAFAFRPVIDRLAERFTVYAWDKRGHGDSDKPKGPYSIQTFADDLLGFLDALRLDKVDLLGHSMGGRTATVFGVGHSARLKRLMLVSSSCGAPKGAYRQHFKELYDLARAEGMEAVFEHPEFRSLIPKNMLSGETGEEYRKSFLRNTPQTYSDTAEALFTMPDLSDKLHRIAVPTWVCYGADDPGPMAYSEAYRKNIPDCTLCLLKGSGHFPIWDSTESFLSELFKFLDAHPVK